MPLVYQIWISRRWGIWVATPWSLVRSNLPPPPAE